VSAAGEFCSWWAICFGVWIASLSAYNTHEFVVAAIAAIPSAAAGVAARRAVRGAWRPPVSALGWLALLPWVVAVDLGRLALLVVVPSRRRRARFQRVQIGPKGTSTEAAGERAVATLLLSLTPGSYIADIDPADGTALVHTLGGPSRLLDRIRR
jgi:multisubunit Na+/H+ antiporter MnhE subunit